MAKVRNKTWWWVILRNSTVQKSTFVGLSGLQRYSFSSKKFDGFLVEKMRCRQIEEEVESSNLSEVNTGDGNGWALNEIKMELFKITIMNNNINKVGMKS